MTRQPSIVGQQQQQQQQQQRQQQQVALDPLGRDRMESPQHAEIFTMEHQQVVAPPPVDTDGRFLDNSTSFRNNNNNNNPLRRSDRSGTIKPNSAHSAQNVVDQHYEELLARYPAEIIAHHRHHRHQHQHPHQDHAAAYYDNHHDVTADSCVSSITRDLPDIYAESMYPSPDKIREALVEEKSLSPPSPSPYAYVERASSGRLPPDLARIMEESDGYNGTVPRDDRYLHPHHHHQQQHPYQHRMPVSVPLRRMDDEESIDTWASGTTPIPLPLTRATPEAQLRGAPLTRAPPPEAQLRGAPLTRGGPPEANFRALQQQQQQHRQHVLASQPQVVPLKNPLSSSKIILSSVSESSSAAMTNNSSSSSLGFVPTTMLAEPLHPLDGHRSHPLLLYSVPEAPQPRDLSSSRLYPEITDLVSVAGSLPGAFPEDSSLASSSAAAAANNKSGPIPSSSQVDHRDQGLNHDNNMEHCLEIKTAAGVIPVEERDVAATSAVTTSSVSKAGMVPAAPAPLAPEDNNSTDNIEDPPGRRQFGVGLALAQSTNRNQDNDVDVDDVVVHEEAPPRQTTTNGTISAAATNSTIRTNGEDPERHDSNLAHATLVAADPTDIQVAESMSHHHQQQNGKDEAFRQSMTQKGLVMVLVVVAVIIVIVALVVTSNKNSGADQASLELAERATAGEEIKIHLEAVLGYDFFQKDAVEPKIEALEWLIYDDPIQLNRSASNLLQRFLVVYLYYTMTQKGPWKDCNPPLGNETFSHTNDLCYYQGLLGDGTHTTPEYTPFYSQYDEVVATRWLVGTHECHWAGLFCNKNDLIESIHLDQMLLNGTLPTYIGHLESLSSLSFKDNHLSGPLPSEIGNLKRLRYLNFEYNQFTGTIPWEWWDLELLDYLNLGFNPLSVGTIPAAIEHLSHLVFFSLDSTGVTGTIPQELFELPNLSWLVLRFNELGGTLPTELTLLQETLSMLALKSNRFVGSIPSEIALLTSLMELDLWGNYFTGTIPDEIFFSGMDNLNGFLVGENDLSGTLSSQFVRLKMLSYLLLSKNPALTGTVPTELGLLTGLRRFDVEGTGLTGSIPSEVCALHGYGTATLEKLKADCHPLDNGEVPMTCPKDCCTKCCNRETGLCGEPVFYRMM